MNFSIVFFSYALLDRGFAYLDPGTGSLLLQIILAGLMGIGVTISIFRKKIGKIFSRNKKGAYEVDDPTAIQGDSDQPRPE